MYFKVVITDTQLGVSGRPRLHPALKRLQLFFVKCVSCGLTFLVIYKACIPDVFKIAYSIQMNTIFMREIDKDKVGDIRRFSGQQLLDVPMRIVIVLVPCLPFLL